jgi:hypothetical protein
LRLFLEFFDGLLDFADAAVEETELGAGSTGSPVWIFSAAANPASSDAISSCHH